MLVFGICFVRLVMVWGLVINLNSNNFCIWVIIFWVVMGNIWCKLG